MDEGTQKFILAVCAIWGAALSTFLGAIKIWETFWRDRIRFETSSFFCGFDQMEDRISVANLSPKTVQVHYWELKWEPRHFWSKVDSIDVSPHDYDCQQFEIKGHSKYTLRFVEFSKFDCSIKTKTGRQLCLYLHTYGRKKPYKLRIHAGY
jgi:hypothetical protein